MFINVLLLSITGEPHLENQVEKSSPVNERQLQNKRTSSYIAVI